MKIWLKDNGQHAGLVNHLTYEGSELVDEPGNADFVLHEPLELPLPTLIAGDLKPDPGQMTHFVSRFYNGESYEPQCIIGLPIIGLMDGDLGWDGPVGCATRYGCTDKHEWSFNNSVLDVFLRRFSYKGFVSFKFVRDKFKGIQTGIPCHESMEF